jgi:hypothetical protein
MSGQTPLLLSAVKRPVCHTYAVLIQIKISILELWLYGTTDTVRKQKYGFFISKTYKEIIS